MAPPRKVDWQRSTSAVVIEIRSMGLLDDFDTKLPHSQQGFGVDMVLLDQKNDFVCVFAKLSSSSSSSQIRFN